MEGTDPPRLEHDTALRFVIIGLFTVLLFRDAWVSDDAYATLRTIDHFVHGHGLVYNIGERAQGYTHPLWMMLLVPFYVVMGHPWWTAVVVGAGTSVAAVTFAARRLITGPATALLVAFPLSRAFVDYSTSGLENSLSHLLVVGLAAAWLGSRDPARRLSLVALFTALLAITRLDLIVLAAPCLVGAVVGARWDLSFREIARRVAVGLSPLVAWYAFALIYYGSLLPTSALAKVWTGIPREVLAKQGLVYLLFQADWDPVTLLVLGAGLASPLFVRDAKGGVLAVGGLLYVVSVVANGADFMAGRFLTTPFVIGLVLLARLPLDRSRVWGVVAVIAAFGLMTPASPLRPESTSPLVDHLDRGVADERAYYVKRGAGIDSVRQYTDDPPQEWRNQAVSDPPGTVRVEAAVGYPAFYGTPGIHWVVHSGITDPVLCRLPAMRRVYWLAGHYDRVIPDGYVETLQTGVNTISPRDVARLYDALHLVNTAPTFSFARLRAIWGLNTGGYPIDPAPWRYPGAVEVPDVPRPGRNDALDAPGVLSVGDSGAVKRFPRLSHATALDLRRRDDMLWEAVFERDGEELAVVEVPVTAPRTGRLSWARIDVPPKVARDGFDAVRILPTSGFPPWALDYLAPRRSAERRPLWPIPAKAPAP